MKLKTLLNSLDSTTRVLIDCMDEEQNDNVQTVGSISFGQLRAKYRYYFVVNAYIVNPAVESGKRAPYLYVLCKEET